MAIAETGHLHQDFGRSLWLRRNVRWMVSRSSCTLNLVVLMIGSASLRIGSSRSRSLRILALTLCPVPSGCGRRVSLKRRISEASSASRKISRVGTSAGCV